MMTPGKLYRMKYDMWWQTAVGHVVNFKENTLFVFLGLKGQAKKIVGLVEDKKLYCVVGNLNFWFEEIKSL